MESFIVDRTASVQPPERVALVQGASRGIGLALTHRLIAGGDYGRVFACCRRPDAATELKGLEAHSNRLTILAIDILDAESISRGATAVRGLTDHLDLLVNCAGVLHDGESIRPEKRLADVNPQAMATAFRVNALGALLVAREFERVLRASQSARFVALSARVGSIADNRRGGWYAYRASKAALNMMIRTLAIEWARLPRPINCFALHPGTVATDLSQPFRNAGSGAHVFTATEAAERLLSTMHSLTAADTGGFFSYDGKKIEW